MNVAFMVSTVPQPSETFILDQARALTARGHHLDIYADYVYPPLRHSGILDTSRESARVYCRRPAFRPRRWQWWLTRLARAGKQLPACPGLMARSMNAVAYGRSAASMDLLEMALYFRERPTYDIVHCHFGPNGVYGAVLRDLGVLRGKLVTSFHGFDVTVLPREKGRGYYRRLFRTGDLFTCNSSFLAQRLEKLGCPKDRLVIFPVGVNMQSVPSHSARRSSTVELLSVARLVEVKGLEYGIRCVSRLTAEFPELRYTIVGDGPLLGELQRLAARLGLSGRVRFMGSRTHREVCELYSAADVFLLPGVVGTDGAEEAQGLALLEAQAAGIPVVASRVGGIPESVADGESGYLVPQRDVEGMASRLRELITEPGLRAEMGKAGRAMVARRFDLGVLSERLVEHYQRLQTDSAADSALSMDAH